MLCYMGNVYSWDTAPIPESGSFQEPQPNAHSHFTGLRFISEQLPRTKIKSWIEARDSGSLIDGSKTFPLSEMALQALRG